MSFYNIRTKFRCSTLGFSIEFKQMIGLTNTTQIVLYVP